MELKDIIQQLKWRVAVKKFDPTKKVTDADFDLLLEAIRLSPSSLGLQPWKFIVVKDPALRVKIRVAGYDQAQLTDASHLVVLCSRTDLSQDYVDSFFNSVRTIRKSEPATLVSYREMVEDSIEDLTTKEIEEWNTCQIYIVLGVLLAACATANIDACPMEGFNKVKCNEILGLADEKYKAQLMCAIGYRTTDDWLSKVEKVRFPKENVILEM